jgi:hypothetical protein
MLNIIVIVHVLIPQLGRQFIEVVEILNVVGDNKFFLRYSSLYRLAFRRLKPLVAFF